MLLHRTRNIDPELIRSTVPRASIFARIQGESRSSRKIPSNDIRLSSSKAKRKIPHPCFHPNARSVRRGPLLTRWWLRAFADGGFGMTRVIMSRRNSLKLRGDKQAFSGCFLILVATLHTALSTFCLYAFFWLLTHRARRALTARALF
jgi:hypothetical protein